MIDISNNKFLSRFGLASVLLTIFIGRFFLLGNGHLDDTDEIPFLLMIQNFDRIVRMDVDAWNDQVFVMWSTHLETLYRLPQVFMLKVYSTLIGMPMESTQSLSLVAFFNLLASMGICYVFYGILRRLSFDRVVSVLGVLLYASFVNSNLYIRHITSYDSAFLLHLIAIYVLLKNKLTYKDYVLSGVLSAMGFFDYYGYYMMYPIVWMIGMYRLENRSINKIVLYTTYLAFPTILLFLILQWFSSLSGHSYFGFLRFFSTTIFHGSPDETLKYALIYMKLVEGQWGNVALVLFFSGLLYMLFYRKSYSSLVKVFLISGVIAYVAYGVYAVLTKEMVFYGRVFHMYYPFIVVGILMVISKHKRLIPLFFTLSFVNFSNSIVELNKIGYPRSVVYQFGLFADNENYEFIHELKQAIEYDYRKPYFDGIEIDIPRFLIPKLNSEPKIKGDLILKNFGFYFHYPDTFKDSFQPYVVPNGLEKVFERKHFMSHPAYTFEYCTRYGREFFINAELKLEIYRK